MCVCVFVCVCVCVSMHACRCVISAIIKAVTKKTVPAGNHITISNHYTLFDSFFDKYAVENITIIRKRAEKLLISRPPSKPFL